jgi:hypothetical protein
MLIVGLSSFFSMTLLAFSLTFLEGILPVMMEYGIASNFVFTPGETRSFPINKFFCSDISVDVTGSSRLSASLWITEEDPQLTQVMKKNVVTPGYNFVCDQPKLGCYTAWRSYMHPHSTLHMKAVNHGSNVAFFTSFSTEKSFQYFLTHSANYINSSNRIRVNEETGLTYDARIGDQIFVLFSQNETRLKISLEFNQTEYSTNVSSLSYCEFHSYMEINCKLPIPFGIGSVNGLLQVTYNGAKSENYSYLEYLTARTNCNYRADSWTVLWLPILIVNVIIGNVLVGVALKLKYDYEFKKINFPVRDAAVTPEQAAIGDSSDCESSTVSPSCVQSQALSPTMVLLSFQAPTKPQRLLLKSIRPLKREMWQSLLLKPSRCCYECTMSGLCYFLLIVHFFDCVMQDFATFVISVLLV